MRTDTTSKTPVKGLLACLIGSTWTLLLRVHANTALQVLRLAVVRGAVEPPDRIRAMDGCGTRLCERLRNVFATLSHKSFAPSPSSPFPVPRTGTTSPRCCPRSRRGWAAPCRPWLTT